MSEQIKNLSVAFSEALVEDLGTETVTTIIERNAAETDPNVCHSHDFCDANMVMLAAFESHFDRVANLNDDAYLMSQAWDEAKEFNFGLDG